MGVDVLIAWGKRHTTQSGCYKVYQVSTFLIMNQTFNMGLANKHTQGLSESVCHAVLEVQEYMRRREKLDHSWMN